MTPVGRCHPVPSCAVSSRLGIPFRTIVICVALLAASCGGDDSTAEPADSAGTGDVASTTSTSTVFDGSSSAAPTTSTSLPLLTLPPLPGGERDVTGTGGPRASYTATWQIRPKDGEPYGYLVAKDGATRTAYRFADVLYVDDQGLDYVCVGLGGDPRCAFAADTGANTLIVDGGRIRVQELGPFAFTNLSFMPQELGSDAPGLDMGPRIVGRLLTSCVTITPGYTLGRFTGAQYCETTTNVVAWFDRTGDGAPEVELTLYDPEVNAALFEPPVAPVEDPNLFAELVASIKA